MSSIEQERKYLLLNESWLENTVTSMLIKQSYLDFSTCSFVFDLDRISLLTNNEIFHFSADKNQMDTLQNILNLKSERSVLRIRSSKPLANLASQVNNFYLTVKGPVSGDSCLEAEFVTKDSSVDTLFRFGCNTIEKIRHLVHYSGYTWEIDQFQGLHDGLIVAEIENQGYSEFPPPVRHMPPWIGLDVTDDYRYRNNNLGKYGLSQIKDQLTPGF